MSLVDRFIALRGILVVVALIAAADAAAWGQPAEAGRPLAEPFRSEYTGDRATGKHVVALWQFDEPEPAADRSGNAHTLTLRGAEFVEDGRFGGALRSYRGWPDEDKPHQARAKNHPELTPTGAFTVEMWLRPADELRGYLDAFLLDKKYVDDNDYQLVLLRETAPDVRRLRMSLGFGDESAAWKSEAIHVPPGRWRHVAFTYDGAGTGTFFVDGSPAGSERKPGYARIAPGRHDLVLGDRIGSRHHGFPGWIDQVRIARGALEFAPVAFELLSPRRVFERMEEAEPLRFGVTNLTEGELSGARVSLALRGAETRRVELPGIASGGRHVVEYRLDTSLRPDVYELAASVELPGDEAFSTRKSFALTIVPRQPAGRMPVVMWGGAGGRRDELGEIGFTHTIGVGCDFRAVWEAGGPAQPGDDARIAAGIEELDAALAAGMRVVSSLSPGGWARSLPEYRRIGRDGQPYKGREDVCARFDRLRQFCGDVGESMARAYGRHPAFDAALIHTEVRDHSSVCFHDHDREAFDEFAGFPIPEEAATMRGIRYEKLPDFPADRVIPDDHPLYVYYKWLWKEGDGWNELHTRLHRGLKAGAPARFWTFHDPAVRAASVWGSGGEVDYLSQWTYSYPDPIRIGLATEELFQMASARAADGSGSAGQKVMKMTQIIWYRSQTAPEPGEEAHVPAADFDDQDVRPRGSGAVDASGRYRAWWEVEEPGARFITIAPMHLREAFWTKIARPIQGIMYHGIGSLLPDITHGSYRHTHPETRRELKRLIDAVVRPLGPTLFQVPDAEKDVAFLESFASEMFAGRGTYGWNTSWAGDMWLVCQYAALQPRVVFEEAIAERGLEGYRVLVMPDCDVLPAGVVEAVLAFQKRGGLVVGDERLCPAVKPDVLVESHARPKQADEARRMNVEKARALRDALDPRYRRAADSSTPDVIPYLRRYGSTDYLFAVNDRRQYGDYVGHHALVMEDGLPADATLTLRRTGHVYDLVARRKLDYDSGPDGSMRLDLHFGPCEGRLLMVTQRSIEDVQVTAPERAKPGESITIRAAVVCGEGRPLDAVAPVRVDLVDPHGRPAEWSGYYGAKDGRIEIRADLARNDAPGLWRVSVEELASGVRRDAYVLVAPP
jgi:hypothetical protein